MEVEQGHGGEVSQGNCLVVNNLDTTCSSNHKSKNMLNGETNSFEILITNDIRNISLTNDVPVTEPKVKNIKEPTPVTLVNVKGGKKNREDKYVDLRVLLDSGSSHSIIQKNIVTQS